MRDELVKRLRDHIAVYLDDRGHVFEDEALCDDAADRIEELEVKLAKAVEALEKVLKYNTAMHSGAAAFNQYTIDAIAELTGGKDG